MRYRWRWYIFLIAALTMGLMLPQWATAWNESRQNASIEIVQIRKNPLVKNKKWNFSQRLRNASMGMATRETEHVGVMNGGQAETAGRRILKKLESAGVLHENVSWELKRCEYYLMVGREVMVISSEDQMGAFYAWLCSFCDEETGAQIGLLIDDETGMMLAAGFSQESGDTSPWADWGKGMDTALHFAVFCEKSYGLSLQSVELKEESDGKMTNYTLIFEDAAGGEMEFPFYVKENAFKFQAMIGFL